MKVINGVLSETLTVIALLLCLYIAGMAPNADVWREWLPILWGAFTQ